MTIVRKVAAAAVVCVLLAAPRLALSQFGTPKFIKGTATAPKTVTVGKPFTVAVQLTIDTPYHIQANTAKDPYVPTELHLSEVKGFRLDKVTYPKAIVTTMSGERISVFEGKIQIKADITVDKSIKPGKYLLPVTVKFQGCNEQACYPPATLDLKTAVVVGAGAK